MAREAYLVSVPVEKQSVTPCSTSLLAKRDTTPRTPTRQIESTNLAILTQRACFLLTCVGVCSNMFLTIWHFYN